MNVLYYLRTFPKLSESFVLNEIHELVRNGHSVAVCSLNEPEESVVHDEFDRLDVPIHYVETPTVGNAGELISAKLLRPRVLDAARYRASPKHHAANLFRAKRCIEFVEELDMDVDHVHTHFADISRVGAAYVAAYFGVPFTVTAHAFDLYREPVGRYTTHLLERADRIVTISRYNERYIREEFTDETPVDVVRAGIRPEKFSPTDETVDDRVLTVARLVEKKGVDRALEAIAQVADGTDVEYHVVGSGRLRDELERRAARLGVDESVTFLSNVSDERLREEFDEARCFLLPARIDESGDRDGIPVALMEAMAMETPPVTTTVSGIPELVDHEENGLLVEPEDSAATARAVGRILRNDDEWARYCEAARRKVVAEFDVADELPKLEATFEAAQVARSSPSR